MAFRHEMLRIYLKKDQYSVLLYSMDQTQEIPDLSAFEVFIEDHPSGRPPDPLEELFAETLEDAAEDDVTPDEPNHFTSIQELDEFMSKLGTGERGELAMYMRTIGQAALLTAAEEVELAMRIEAGVLAQKCMEDKRVRQLLRRHSDADLQLAARDGAAAKKRLFEANLRLVVWMAHRLRDYRNPRVSFMDIVQQGNIGLMRAVEKFDFAKGNKFSTYASWWIRQAITADQGDSYLCRLPAHINRDIRRLRKTERELDAELGRTPTEADLASELNFDISYIADLKRYQDKGIYIDGFVGEGNERSSFEDVLPVHNDRPEEKQIDEGRQALVHQALAEMLPDDIRIKNTNYSDILRRRFGLRTGKPQSCAEIGSIYGLTKQAIEAREKKALAKLRTTMQRILAREVQ